jgi:Ankyrin repeats (3 copies)
VSDFFWNGNNIHILNECTFRMSCEKGHLNVAQWLIDLGKKATSPIDIHAGYEYSFKKCCANGHLDVAKWLIDPSKENSLINIHIDREYAFRHSCKNGHLHVAQWLTGLGSLINIRARNEYALKHSCENSHLNVVEWLINLYDMNVEQPIKDTCMVLTKKFNKETLDTYDEYFSRIKNVFLSGTVQKMTINIEIVKKN